MSEESIRCQAKTKAGTQCKKTAQAGTKYCYVHREPAQAKATANTAEFDEMVAELNAIAAKLQAEEPNYAPPPFSPVNLLKLMRENIDRFTPDVQRGLLNEIQESLQGASPKDMLDPATWKGMVYLLSYSMQSETAVLRERLNEHLARLPGGETLVTMQGMLEGASPRDLLDTETWKGMWYLVNYSMQNQAQDVKRRILGEED